MLTKRTKYALRALMYLAERQSQGPVLIAQLAADEGMPKKFLERILLDLNKQGYLQSKKGKGGGYFIARPLEEISIGDVVRLMDGPLAPVSCVSKTAYRPCAECKDEATCGIKKVMQGVRDSISKILDNTTLADMIAQDNVMSAWAYVI